MTVEWFEKQVAGFVLDEQLFVVEVMSSGLSVKAGVVKGMRLVGFQSELISDGVKWSRLREFCSQT